VSRKKFIFKKEKTQKKMTTAAHSYMSNNNNRFYMIVDIEAIICTEEKQIPMELGYIIADRFMHVCYSYYIDIKQSKKYKELLKFCGKENKDLLDKGIEGYRKVCGEHKRIIKKGMYCSKWSTVKTMILRLINDLCNKEVYAKGKTLEEKLLGIDYIQDLEIFGCPKYPLYPHNPKDECIYFYYQTFNKLI